jgi:hypothetical protein
MGADAALLHIRSIATAVYAHAVHGTMQSSLPAQYLLTVCRMQYCIVQEPDMQADTELNELLKKCKEALLSPSNLQLCHTMALYETA